jgi:hypothetical protein
MQSLRRVAQTVIDARMRALPTTATYMEIIKFRKGVAHAAESGRTTSRTQQLMRSWLQWAMMGVYCDGFRKEDIIITSDLLETLLALLKMNDTAEQTCTSVRIYSCSCDSSSLPFFFFFFFGEFRAPIRISPRRDRAWRRHQGVTFT